jgi:branched-chain amino acid transport system ATP-binding protein
MLAVRSMNSFYGASHVLHDVALNVREGELVALLGRNGAGKTTTLASLMGTIRVRDAEIVLDGVDVSRMPSHQRLRHGLALVPSGARVFGNLTVEENLSVVRPRRVDNGMSWTIPRVYDFFPKLAQLRSSQAGNLSGGERQMLAVGRGLMANPKVLMLDEPSEGLAPVVVQSIGKLLGQLEEAGLSVLLAEQNHRFALDLAERAYLIDKGQIRHESLAATLEGSEALHRYLGV